MAGLHMSFIFLWCLEAASKQQVLFKTQEGNFIYTHNVETVLCLLDRLIWFIEGLDDLRIIKRVCSCELLQIQNSYFSPLTCDQRPSTGAKTNVRKSSGML
jgi:hypothetical protein